MNSVEIPAGHWQQFCERFTQQHHGWLIDMHRCPTGTLESDKARDDAPLALLPRNRPLQEVREGDHGDCADVIVTVGQGSDETSYLIEDAIALYSLKNGGAERGLRIDASDGTSTLVEFRAAVASSTFDAAS